MLDIEIIDMDKDISTDSNKLGRDEKLEYSEINVQEMKDRANAYSPMEKDVALKSLSIDMLWDEIRRRETHNRTLLRNLRDMIQAEGSDIE